MSDRTWTVLEACAADLGYELVDLELSQGGLMRVFIDIPTGERLITIDDCEALSHQLVHQLPVEGIDFERLEVSSPGLDRRLTKHVHFVRFEGQPIKLKLRQPVGNRRNFEGLLSVIADPATPEGQPNSYRLNCEEGTPQAFTLDFHLNDVEQARLVPDFQLSLKKEKRR